LDKNNYISLFAEKAMDILLGDSIDIVELFSEEKFSKSNLMCFISFKRRQL